MSIAAPSQPQASCDTAPPLQDPHPAAEPAPPAIAGDRFALLFWGGCALLLAYLLMKDLVVSLCTW